jgi:hypothetical protein
MAARGQALEGHNLCLEADAFYRQISGSNVMQGGDDSGVGIFSVGAQGPSSIHGLMGLDLRGRYLFR